MSDERQETVEDIVAEMRKRAEEVYEGQAGYPESWKDQMNRDEICDIADRIEAAHKREVAELRAENARLRSALKPVLECKVVSAMTVKTGQGEVEYCAVIIEKAQHIYNEGEDNQNEGDVK